ncbi:YraN family protein [Thalassotalea sp. ND16A]|uniref:YraN family protein n=1 Tax=Thalassotalea sp. ND16A TaxID=1535422 RepID=UPI0006912FEE|nr:YraN family protein [Thalassotalea sp. ND16A]
MTESLNNSKQQGSFYEQAALNYLLEQQLELIEKNFQCRFGEIDLIMQDRNTLVFIEVKYRKSAHFGDPLEMVSKTKQRKICKTAQVFLQKQGMNEYNTFCRFDVVSIKGPAASTEITWLKNAFNGV